MFNVVEVAQRYRVSRDTVFSWVKDGRITAINVGRAGSERRQLRFTQEALDAFERGQKTRAPAPRVPVYTGKQYV